MLLAADADSEEHVTAVAPPTPAAVVRATTASPPVASGRYGEKRVNPMAVVLTVGIHLAVIAGLAGVHFTGEQKKRERLTVVNLQLPEPPPPPPPAQKVPVPKSPIVVPVPRLQIATPTPTVATVVEPPPEPVKVAAPAPPAPPAPPSTVTAGDLGARMVSGAPPRYPVESRRQREQGTVVLALTLGVDGEVAAISIARSSGFSRLDDAALRAVRKWRWSPTMRNGQPVMVRGQVEIPFVLQG